MSCLHSGDGPTCRECLADELEQTRVQLAGCGAAALGYDGGCKKGDYGWSASFGDVMQLRERWAALHKQVEELRARAERAEREVHQLAEVAMGDCRETTGHDRDEAADCAFCDPWRERVAAIEDLHAAAAPAAPAPADDEGPGF